MKFRWIPVLIVMSVLLGIMMGIEIHNLDTIFLHKEKKIETSKITSINSLQKNEKKQIETSEAKPANKQEGLKDESKEAFLETTEIKSNLSQKKRSFLSKAGNNIDKGVTYVFSNLINRIN